MRVCVCVCPCREQLYRVSNSDSELIVVCLNEPMRGPGTRGRGPESSLLREGRPGIQRAVTALRPGGAGPGERRGERGGGGGEREREGEREKE